MRGKKLFRLGGTSLVAQQSKARHRLDDRLMELAEGRGVGYEVMDSAILGVEHMLKMIGEDPEREGLVDTPYRVTKSMFEMTVGYEQDPAEILGRSFDLEDVSYSGAVVLRNTEFVSLCEHHCLPFFGTASIAYIPSDGRVVGISKLARLVDCFARRLQVQERLTSQIADAIQEELKPIGVAVLIKAQHLCMKVRGVEKNSSEMVTSTLYGSFLEDPSARQEVMSLL